MSVVTISIHKHNCAICGCLFFRREMPGQDGCLCNALDYVEFCPPCQTQIDEAGFLGKLVGQVVKRLRALENTAEASQEVAR